jgi:predicted enzyme related to lactoylglutathione lyase/quinol monooxygenase YgiN
MTKGCVVIGTYRPKQGKDQELLALLDQSFHALRASDLLGYYPRSVLKAAEGAYLEIFEWMSPDSMDQAMKDQSIQAVWKKIGDICEMLPISSLKEAAKPFAEFERVEGKRRNRIVHFDIQADDPNRCIDFYSKVFGWSVKKWGSEDYWLVDTGDESEIGINGGIMKRQAPEERVANTIAVDSVDDYARKIEQNGGKIVMPKMAVNGVGWFVYAKDTEGNAFGIMQFDEKAMEKAA